MFFKFQKAAVVPYTVPVAEQALFGNQWGENGLAACRGEGGRGHRNVSCHALFNGARIAQNKIFLLCHTECIITQREICADIVY